MVLGKAIRDVPRNYPGHLDYVEFYADFDLEDIGDGSEEYHLALRDLAQRALEKHRTVILGVGQKRKPELGVDLSADENSRYVFINSYNYASYQNSSFEDYEFLPKYDAIWNRYSDTVEARVDWARFGIIKYAPPGQELSNGRVVADGSSGAELRFGWPSPAAQIFFGITDPTDPDSAAMTLSLVGTNIRSAEEAIMRLESIGNALLFQISLLDGDLPSLVRTSPRPGYGESGNWNRPYRWNLKLGFPRRSIQAEPLALYYYAGTLRDDFPLLKFLAYYQILEYYFARYTPAETTRGRRFGSEREQLQATIAKCVDHSGLCTFLTEHHHEGVALSRHLADAQRLAGVNTVNIDQVGKDVARDLTNRIYGIRNRIVHAKQNYVGTSREPIFPFSEESKALQPDIEVLRYVAASVLIESAISIDE